MAANECSEELDRHVFPGGVLAGELQGHAQHLPMQNSAIQAVPSACASDTPGGSGHGTVEDADIVQPQEASWENRFLALGILAVDPPGEVQQQLGITRGAGNGNPFFRLPAWGFSAIWKSPAGQEPRARTGGLTSPKSYS